MPQRHYTFATQKFVTMIAHGGIGKIQTARVEQAPSRPACNFVDLTVMPPGSTIGVHRHGPDNEEIYIIISGTGRMRLENQAFFVGPGDVIVNSANGAHGLENVGETELHLVVVEVPLAKTKAVAA
jgi:mannose-6-phosphate isomerase-like protein (cupin superfamily)